MVKTLTDILDMGGTEKIEYQGELKLTVRNETWQSHD